MKQFPLGLSIYEEDIWEFQIDASEYKVGI